jgi:hypothetical protein
MKPDQQPAPKTRAERIAQSIEAGLEFLKTNQEEIIFKLKWGDYNRVEFLNEPAIILNAVVYDDQETNSGTFLGPVLQTLIERAKLELGYATEEEEAGRDKIITLKK